MSWAKLDDRLHDSKEFNGLSDAALAFWTRLQSRVANLGSDGLVSQDDLSRLDFSRPDGDRDRVGIDEIVAELTERGHLVLVGDSYMDPGWARRNITAELGRADEAYAAARKRLSYAKTRGESPELLDRLKEEEQDALREVWRARDNRARLVAGLEGVDFDAEASGHVDTPAPRSTKGTGHVARHVDGHVSSRPVPQGKGKGKKGGRSASSALRAPAASLPHDLGLRKPAYADTTGKFREWATRMGDASTGSDDDNYYCGVCGKIGVASEMTLAQMQPLNDTSITGEVEIIHVADDCRRHSAVVRLV